MATSYLIPSAGLDSLHKNELIFELGARNLNVNVNSPVSRLRVDLRIALRDELGLDLKGYASRFDHDKYKEEWSAISDFVKQTKQVVSEFDEKPMSLNQMVRQKCRILHFKNRIVRFMYLTEDREGAHRSILSWNERLDNYLEYLVGKFDPVELESNGNQLDLDVSIIDDKFCKLMDADEDSCAYIFEPVKSNSNVHGDVCDPPSSVQQYSEKVREKPKVTNLHSTQLGVSSHSIVPGHYQSTLSTGSYSKLSNPVENILKSVPRTDGFDSKALLKVLEYMFEIKEIYGLPDQDIYLLLSNCTSTPLREKFLSCKINSYLLADAHRLLLNNYLPISLREKLKAELIMRPQGQNESLPKYIEEVRLNNKLLYGGFSDEELIDHIIVNLNFTTRTKITFFGRPSTFEEMHDLCIMANNVQYADQTRSGERNRLSNVGRDKGRVFSSTNESSGRVNNASDRPKMEAGSSHSTQNASRVFLNGSGLPPRNNSVKCHFCGRLGHIKKNCYAFKRSLNSNNGGNVGPQVNTPSPAPRNLNW